MTKKNESTTSATPAEPMPMLPYICLRCRTQQHADGICANCGSSAITPQTLAPVADAPGRYAEHEVALYCPDCKQRFRGSLGNVGLTHSCDNQLGSSWRRNSIIQLDEPQHSANCAIYYPMIRACDCGLNLNHAASTPEATPAPVLEGNADYERGFKEGRISAIASQLVGLHEVDAVRSLTTERRTVEELREALREYAEEDHDRDESHRRDFKTCDHVDCVRARALIGE